MGLGPLTVIVPSMFPVSTGGRGTKSTVKLTVFIPAASDTVCSREMNWPPTVDMEALTLVLPSGNTAIQYALEPLPSQSLPVEKALVLALV